MFQNNVVVYTVVLCISWLYNIIYLENLILLVETPNPPLPLAYFSVSPVSLLLMHPSSLLGSV